MDNEEILEQETVEQPEPLIIETKGKWQPFEVMSGQKLEVGKTYDIKIDGVCEFAISADKPTAGIGANKITYTKDNTNRLWIRTGN